MAWVGSGAGTFPQGSAGIRGTYLPCGDTGDAEDTAGGRSRVSALVVVTRALARINCLILLRGRTELMVAGLLGLCLADVSGKGYFTTSTLVSLRGGYLTAGPLVILVLSLVLLAAAIADPRASTPLRRGWSFAAPAMVLTLLFPLGLSPPILVGGLALTTLLIAVGGPSKYVCAVLATAVGLWIAVVAVPLLRRAPHIDVLTMLSEGGLRLIHGLNPYTASYPSTTPGVHTLPFTDSPMAAILAAPADWLGDPRYMGVLLAVVSVAAMAVLIARSPLLAGGRQRAAVIAIALASPLIPMLAWYGWTELYAIAPFSLWLVLRDSHRGVAVVCLAIALGAKLTLLPVLVPLFLWSPRMRRDLIMAGALALAFIYLPFIIWTGPARFWYDVIGFQLKLPLQPYTLSFSGMLSFYGLPVIPGVATAAVALAALVVLCRDRPKDLGDLFLRSTVFLFIVFLFAPFAEFNFWALVASMLIVAVATAGVVEPFALPRWFWVVAPEVATAE
jgi:hypothetical protein